MKAKTKTKLERKSKWNTYNFDYNKVMNFCDKLKKNNEKILYLEFVLKEKRNGDNGLDLDLYFPGTISFEEKIKNEIDYLYKELKLLDPYKAEGYNKIVWQRNKQDFPALFSKMINLGFFTFRKNKFVMLSNHFTWNDGEMTAEQLKHLLNNINNKPETHQVSDEVKFIIDNLK